MSISYFRKFASYITFLVCVMVNLHAQEPVVVERSNNKVVIEGSIYYVHVVKPGHTLYSIAKAYNVSVKEIIIENPGVTVDLRIAQVLKIPANPDAAYSVTTVEPDGQEGQHIVKAGETLFSISRKYGCTVEMLLQLNPGIEVNGIQIDQKIRIPSATEEQNDLSFDEEGFIFHKVKRRETLYSISRYYGVAVSEIKTVNPEIGWGGPKIGEIVRIPKPNTTISSFTQKDTLVTDTLELQMIDTLIIEEYKYEELKDRYFGRNRTLNICYLIPFDFRQQEPLDTLLKNVKSPVKRERIIEQYERDAETPQSVRFLEFFEGSLMAIDTLTDAGLNINVHFFDTHKSMYHTREILEREEMMDMDLIFGPFYTFNLELVAEFGKSNHIPVVTPFHSDDSLVNGNPYLFQLTPSYKTEYERNVKYIARSFDENLIFVHNGDTLQSDRIEFYKKSLFNELEKNAALEAVHFKEVVSSDGNMEELILALKRDRKNIIVLPAIDEAFASRVASILYYKTEEYDIELFGSSFWVGFDDIEVSYIHDLGLTISHPHKYDFQDPVYKNLLRKFRENFFNEPVSFTRSGSSFGMVGYDMSLYFISALQEYGPAFILHLDEYTPEGMLTEYKFERVNPSGGFENRLLNFYHFNEDMSVSEVQLPDMPEIHHHLIPADEEIQNLWWFENRQDTIQNDSTIMN